MQQIIQNHISDYKANEVVIFAIENPILSTVVCIACAVVGLLLGVLTQYNENKNFFA